MDKPKILLLNLPSPPKLNISKEWAGTFGTGAKTNRKNYGHNGPVLFPINMLYSASELLKRKSSFTLLDCQAECLEPHEILHRITEQQPKLIITMLSLPALASDLKIISEIKEKFPGVVVAALGATAQTMQETLLSNGIDILINGSFPYSRNISELSAASKISFTTHNYKKIRGITYKSDGKTCTARPTPKEEIRGLNLKAYDFFDLARYRMAGEKDESGRIVHWFPVLTGTGCMYSCAYCPYPLTFGRKLIEKPVAEIMKELSFLYEKGINEFLMREVIFTYDRKRTIKLCNEIINSNMKIRFFFETRADLVDEELLLLLKKAGCFKINYGVETGNEEVLRSIGKPTLKMDTIRQAFKLTKKAGILTQAHIILGLPGETRKSMNKTYDLINQVDPDEVNWNIITPYPGTPLYRIAADKGWISGSDYSMYTSYSPVMRNEYLNERDLFMVRSEFLIRRKIHKIMKRFAQ